MLKFIPLRMTKYIFFFFAENFLSWTIILNGKKKSDRNEEINMITIKYILSFILLLTGNGNQDWLHIWMIFILHILFVRKKNLLLNISNSFEHSKLISFFSHFFCIISYRHCILFLLISWTFLHIHFWNVI